MGERRTFWWVGRTTDKGTNVVRKVFDDEEEATKFAEKHDFGPPKKFVAANLYEEIYMNMKIKEQKEFAKEKKGE